MCGLVAVIQKRNIGFAQKDIDIFTQALFVDQLRGTDGTGIFFNTKKGTAHTRMLKMATEASKFIRIPEYAPACTTMFNESNFVVGHNRSATKGKIDNACTHPFREGNIILVHNGTLFGHRALSKDSDVDSHAICKSISEIGYEATLKKIDGAFALIWFDTEKRQLFLCRNKDRPLFIIETKDFYLVTSELKLGQWILDRNKILIVEETNVEVENVYKFSLPEMSGFVKEKVEYLKPFFHVQNQFNHVNHKKHPYEDQASMFDDSPYWAEIELKKLREEQAAKAKAETALGREADYIYGDSVRFKGGHLRIQGKHSCYLEGDFYKKGGKELEDAYRIKIWGSEALLRQYEFKELVGKVSYVERKVSPYMYYLCSIKEVISAAKQNVILLPSPATQNKEVACDWCGGKYEESKGEKYDCGDPAYNYVICPTCAASINKPAANYKH